MHNFIHWYNQNRKKILLIVITVISIFFIAREMMNIMSNNNKNEITPISQEELNNLNSITLSSQKSAITGNNTQINKEGIIIIDDFVSYCNSGNIQSAYDLISNECKEELFPNIEKFKEIYYNPIFKNGIRNSKIENWTGDIYIISYIEDALSKGYYSKESNRQDYITMIKDKEGKYKLNINSYLGRTELNKVVEHDEVQITLKRKDVYMDYEIYTVEFNNKSGLQILIADLQDDGNISYLVDNNNIKYNIAATELTETQLIVSEEQTKTLKLKYYNQYGSTKIINKLVFPKVCLNYSFYKINKEIYKNFKNFSINI